MYQEEDIFGVSFGVSFSTSFFIKQINPAYFKTSYLVAGRFMKSKGAEPKVPANMVDKSQNTMEERRRASRVRP